MHKPHNAQLALCDSVGITDTCFLTDGATRPGFSATCQTVIFNHLLLVGIQILDGVYRTVKPQHRTDLLGNDGVAGLTQNKRAGTNADPSPRFWKVALLCRLDQVGHALADNHKGSIARMDKQVGDLGLLVILLANDFWIDWFDLHCWAPIWGLLLPGM